MFERFDGDAIDEVRGDLRRWHLLRIEDESGVSGTGIVASGVEFHDGTVAYRWRTDPSSYCVQDSIEEVEEIRSHGGRTHIVWEDP